MVDDEERLQIVLSAVALAYRMREVGLSKTAYSKILRETIHFVWEIREVPKHSPLRMRSKAAEGLLPSELDYDHAIPMRVIIEMIMNKWPDREAVMRIVENMVHGVLITKGEHDLLREKGLNAKMPDDWKGNDWTARYSAVGIVLASQYSGEFC